MIAGTCVCSKPQDFDSALNSGAPSDEPSVTLGGYLRP